LNLDPNGKNLRLALRSYYVLSVFTPRGHSPKDPFLSLRASEKLSLGQSPPSALEGQSIPKGQTQMDKMASEYKKWTP
jgi:hypothetical protein